MSSYQKRVQVASLQRVYNAIVNATSNYMRDNEVDDLSNSALVTSDGMKEFFEKYFDAVKICTSDNGAKAFNCLEEKYTSSDRGTTFNPATIQNSSAETVCASLSMGAVVIVHPLIEEGEIQFGQFVNWLIKIFFHGTGIERFAGAGDFHHADPEDVDQTPFVAVFGKIVHKGAHFIKIVDIQ